VPPYLPDSVVAVSPSLPGPPLAVRPSRCSKQVGNR
jgi:hypothetical protein